VNHGFLSPTVKEIKGGRPVDMARRTADHFPARAY
jgi:hypothetical protein